MKKDLLKIAAEPITSEAYNVTVPFSRLGFPELGEGAEITLRPPRYAPGAARYLAEGRLALARLEASLMNVKPGADGAIPLDPARFAGEAERSRRDAAHAMECGYVSLLVAGWSDVEVLPATADSSDVKAAAAEAFTYRQACLMPSGDGAILSSSEVTEPGYDLEAGSDCLPHTERNFWKLLQLRPLLASAITAFTNDDANFPDLPDPLASRKNGADGAKSTSPTETPRKGASGRQKRAGRPQSSPAN